VESLDYGDIDGICRAARMRNEWLRQCGLFAGSAVVEAGCEAVIGQRLNRHACTGPPTAPTAP
jgi:hypothetical protein